MIVSAVIPHWGKSDKHDQALKMCVDSLEGADEIIIVANDGIGFGKACNIGLKIARGDYICVINNDTELVSGSLRDLCVSGCVTVPKMLSGQVDNNPRAFYCVPKEVYLNVGGYDERFEGGFYEDDDIMKRWHNKRVEVVVVDSVEVEHIGGLTMREINPDRLMKDNKAKFEAKWGKQ